MAFFMNISNVKPYANESTLISTSTFFGLNTGAKVCK